MKGRGSLRAASATASLPGQVLARRLFARAAASKAKQEWSSPLSRCYIRVPQRDGRQGLAKQQRPAHAGVRVLPDCTAAGRRTFGESVRGRGRRPPELITESGAPAVRRRVMVNDRPGTDPKRSRQIGRSRGHATRRLPLAALYGGKTPFFQGGRRKARDRASAVHDGQQRIYGYHARSLRLVRLPATARGRRGHDCFYSGRRGMPAFRLER